MFLFKRVSVVYFIYIYYYNIIIFVLRIQAVKEVDTYIRHGAKLSNQYWKHTENRLSSMFIVLYKTMKKSI